MRALLIFVLLLAICGAGAAFWAWNDLHALAYHNLGNEPIEVARGERLDQILNDLQNHGVLHSALPLRIYLKIKKQAPIVQAGNYYFPSPITPLQVLQKLKEGGQFDRITVIEGWTHWDIANALATVPALHTDTASALRLLDDAGPIRDIDATAQNLEGYLFPDTYFLVANSSAEEVVSDMVKRFREVWTKTLQRQALARGMTAHQVVTIASIIETEAKLKSERPLIASVIENRLRHNMPLGTDSTVVYASKIAGAWKNDGKVYLSDINRVSPYNTRRVIGLPPGPVGSPGLSSLEAAVAPARTDYLYYVRNPDRNDGAHNFYVDEKGFAAGVQALRAWEQKQKKSTASTPPQH